MDLLYLTRNPSADYIPLESLENNFFFQGSGDSKSSVLRSSLVSVLCRWELTEGMLL